MTELPPSASGSASGKIDRRALPIIEPDSFLGQTLEPPVGAIECMLAQLWCQLLGIASVGRRANFFGLGGHSLLIVKMMVALHRRGHRIDAQLMYQYPVLSDLAAHLETSAASGGVNQTDQVGERSAPQELSLGEHEMQAIGAAIPGGHANIQQICGLGPLQQGMLYHCLLEHGGDPYVLGQVVRFSRVELLDAYIAALRRTIDRHGALRVSIHHHGLAHPVQVVWREAPLSVEAVEPEAGGDALAALKRLCRPGVRHFDIAKAPLQRCFYCYDTQRNEWVLLRLLHHIAVDHASVERMQQEIEAQLCVTTCDATAPAPVPLHSVSLAASATQQQAAFFERMLKGYEPAPPPLGTHDYLPADVEISEAWRSLAGVLCAGIRQQAKSYRVSVAAVFHLAWAKVLACLTGQEDVVFGTILLGRSSAGASAAASMGQFINTLPIRLRLQDLPVGEGLRSTHDTLMQMVGYEQTPLVVAQQSVQMAKTLPLFTTLFNYRHSEVRIVPARDPWLAATPSRVPGVSHSAIIERTHYPIALNVDDFGSDALINVQVEQGHDAERLCDYFETALGQLVEALERAPQRRMSSLNVLPASEIEQVLRRWNQTDADFAHESCLHQLIEQQVARTPDRQAVVFESDGLTYRQLNARANQLARFLVAELGIRPDSLVGVCAERSIELVVALLAILKAGGAYVPLDPSYPADRLQYMLTDAAPRAVLTHGVPNALDALLREYAAACSARVLDFDRDAAQWLHQSTDEVEPQERGLTASHLAYVIYTSGSTGRPKGVMNEHRGVVNRLVWMQKAYGLTADDAVLQKTPFSFDVSVWEFFWPLMYGARLVIARPEGHKDPAYLAALIQEQRITTLHFVPSMLNVFLEHAPQEAGEPLRRVLCSGEALPAHSVQRFRERFPHSQLHNLYGPTEAAIDVTAWDCTAGPLGEIVPIGRPIDNLRLYILDANGQPTPRGVAGELHIAGIGVARGYLNQPELTDARFIKDPFGSDTFSTNTFSTNPGGRMYRTGDLARYLERGEIEYLGRNDFQVKLRGFRIELGEVEAAVRSHAAVSDCVALVREDTIADPRLVVYVIPADQEPGADAHELERALREHLQTRLPAYMLPSHCVCLDVLPLSANGKLDRKALPAPGGSASALAMATEPPRQGTEVALAAVWAEVLHTREIGRQSHFFEVGGHSLLAVALLARIHEKFAVSLTLGALVSRLELASQARLIDAAIAARGAELSAKVASSERSPLAVASIRALPLQKAIYKATRLDADDLSNNSSVILSFESGAQPDLRELRRALESVFARHVAFGAKFVLEADEVYLQPAKRFVFRLEKRYSLGSLVEDVRDFARPFSLDDGMNVRGRWVIDQHRCLLLLDFSHACIDGSGLKQILLELTAPTAGKSPTTGLAGYSELFYGNEFAQVRGEHANFWSSQLRGWSPAAPHASHTVQRTWHISLDRERRAQVQAATSRLKISSPEFFMAVFLRFKASLEEQADQLTSMIFHGRDSLLQQTVIAPLATVLPVRVQLRGSTAQAVSDITAAVREACRHYLFDADALAARAPEISRLALSPSSFFGYFQKDDFVGRIAGAPCRQIEAPNVGGGQPHWTLTCEVADHELGVDVHLEAVSFRAARAEAEWELLFESMLSDVLDAAAST